VVREIGSALAFAHSHGVIHRDVKPENIVLEHGTGRALLADFGIACIREEMASSVDATVGTPAYMSPEQVSGAPLDGRSDVYSLGLVGWELLAGRRPYTGDSPYEVMYKQQTEPLPSLTSLGIAAPASLIDALERATDKTPAARWQSAADLVAALGPEDAETAVAALRNAAADAANGRTDPGVDLADGERGHLSGDTDDPAVHAPTLVMSADRRRRVQPGSAPRIVWPEAELNESRPAALRNDEREDRDSWRSLRWTAAAVAAVAVTASMIGALVGRGPVAHAFDLATTATPASSAAAPAPAQDADSSVPQRSVSPGDMAMSVGPDVVLDTTQIESPALTPIPLPARDTNRELALAEGTPRLHHTAHVDRTRTAAATATLALEAYTGAVGSAHTPSSSTQPFTGAVAPAVVDTEQPLIQPASADAAASDVATAVRVRPAPQAAPPADTMVLTPATPDAPAVGVRVGHPAPTDQPACEALFPGSHVCRIRDPRTGKMQYYYIR
jgi:hypothetical protein